MLETLSTEPLLANTAADYAEKPAYRPLTKFEARGMKLGFNPASMLSLIAPIV